MDYDDPTQRTRQNVAAIVVLLVIVIGGAVLFLTLSHRLAVLDCVAARWRDCGQTIDAGQR
jgi:hypothetical protein